MLRVKGPGFPCMWLPVYLSGHASSVHSAVTGNRKPRGPIPFWQPSSSLKSPHPFQQLFNGPPVPIHQGPSVTFKDHLSSSVWKETMLGGEGQGPGQNTPTAYMQFKREARPWKESLLPLQGLYVLQQPWGSTSVRAHFLKGERHPKCSLGGGK